MLSTQSTPRRLHTALDDFFAELRAREFAKLNETGLAYVDYTGSALPTASQIAAHNESLGASVFGNPHADSSPSRRSTEALDVARSLLLAHLDADSNEYTVCFTANATGAVKLVAESYPFAPNGAYALSTDNHNSLQGVREFARRCGARVEQLPLDSELRLAGAAERLDALRIVAGPKLFSFPAQSNFSGTRHPLSLIDIAHECGFDVLLDAAAYLPSSALSLRRHRADFVALSFYKPLLAYQRDSVPSSPGTRLSPGFGGPGSPAGQWSMCRSKTIVTRCFGAQPDSRMERHTFSARPPYRRALRFLPTSACAGSRLMCRA
jgi:selenocysteine lyase/cysteine desulfurase